MLFHYDLGLILLAAVVCVFGSFVTTRLLRTTLWRSDRARIYSLFLSGVTAGCSIWSTHFVAILSYRSGLYASFDLQMIIVSVVLVVCGSAFGFHLAGQKHAFVSRVLGGASIGLSIAAMQYINFLSHPERNVLVWDMRYVVSSVVLTVALSVLFVHFKKTRPANPHTFRMIATPVTLILAIFSIHFVGVAAFHQTSVSGLSLAIDAADLHILALDVALVALVVISTGLCSYLIEDRAVARSRTDLVYMATHDDLTKLPNRRYFSDHLTELCGDMNENREARFSLVLIDLDRFKPVNDTLGHTFGDRVLAAVAGRLSKLLRANDVLARLGGDEFAIVKQCSNQDDPVFQQVVELLSRPFLIDGHVVEIGGSVGVARAPHDGKTPEELIRNADIALYAAKAGGRSKVSIYEPAMSDEIELRRSLEIGLRRAVARNEFEVYYQPQVDAKTGLYTGAEALVRWQHPKRGTLSPALFIPAAEELGLINSIGTFVLAEACKAAISWPSHLVVAVNLSPVQIMDRRLIRTLKTILSETGLDPKRLQLEITETALIGNDEHALGVLKQIRALGIGISLDDFGTGYSSLCYLHRFPIDEIKIDRSFIGEVPDNPDSMSIIEAIAHLGLNLKMRIVAEGVETEEQRVFAQVCGCDRLQGYLFSKPVCRAEIDGLFAPSSSVKRIA